MTEIVYNPSLEGQACALAEQTAFGHRLAVVDDANTHAALGERVLCELSRKYEMMHIDLGDVPEAKLETSQRVAEQVQRCDGVVAIGSGTVNDLCKHAAHTLKIPYTVMPTAPSMNGYVSANASLKKGALKSSYAATPPKAVWCDLGVIGHAPKRLIHAGLGDSLARPTAQADWAMSYILLGTDYDASVYGDTHAIEKEVFTHSDKLMRGDTSVIRLLMELLIESGHAMTRAKSSAPASQGEHMIAHCYEMLFGHHGTYHGEEIAVTTLTCAQIQGELLKSKEPSSLRKQESRDPSFRWDDETRGLYAKKLQLTEERLHNRLHEKWSDARDAMAALWIAPERLREILLRAGAPTMSEDIGWSKENYAKAVERAPFTRDRFTCLDLIV